jgi:hypothetical protein
VEAITSVLDAVSAALKDGSSKSDPAPTPTPTDPAKVHGS